MKPRPRRSCAGYTLRPNLDRLESRLVLSGTSATWLGQDGHDLAGPSSGLASDGIQDVHIQISGIPNNRQIAWADLMGLGGGRWVYKGITMTGPAQISGSTAEQPTPANVCPAPSFN